MIPLKTPEEIEKLRKSASILVRTFRFVEPYIKEGVTTDKLDKLAEEAIHSLEGKPAFKDYKGYPATICASIDEEVVHGIPSSRQLMDGQIISVDIGVQFEGYFADASKTYGIGVISGKKQELINTTQQALHRGIRKCREGNRLSDISYAIQCCAEAKGFETVRSLVGHGIGQSLHEEPQIPNYGPPHRGHKLKAGMVFAIEPMINIGSYEVKVMNDGWTVETKDGQPSAHFEHTILLTEGKPEILTMGIEDSPLESNDG